MENKKDKEEKCEGKRINKIIIGIVSAVVLVAVVATVGVRYKKNEEGKGYANNDVNEIEGNIENEAGKNGEIKTGSNETSNENDLGIKLSNYVVAGSEEARRSEEILKKAQEEREEEEKKEKEEIEKNKEESKRTKYTGVSEVQLASNAENTKDIRSAVQEIATGISSGTLTLSPTSSAYSGQRNTPDPKLMVGGKELILGKDYKITYTNNIDAGTATATATGINEYTGTKTANFTIAPKSINVEWQGGTQFTYNGNVQKPTVKSPVTGVNGDQVYLTVKIQGGKTPKDVGNYVAEAEISNVVKGTVKTAPGAITVTSKITTDNTGNITAGSNVTKGTTLYVQITATQTNGAIKSIYSAKNGTKTASAKYTLPITENGTYGFAVVGSENTSKWYTVTVDNYAKSVPIEQIEIGDYVKYTPDTGSATWRVWSKEGSNVIITPVGGIGSLTLSGAIDWLNAETIITNECKKYTSSSLGITGNNIRSMNIEDIEKVMPASEVSSAKTELNYGKEYSYTSGTFYAEAATSGTFDKYNKELRMPKTATSSNPVKLKGTYWYRNSLNWNKLGNKKSGMTGDTYGNIFGNNICWLASRSVQCTPSFANFCVWFVTNGTVTGWSLYTTVPANYNVLPNKVCPLVTLSSTLFAGGGAGTSSDPWQLVKN